MTQATICSATSRGKELCSFRKTWRWQLQAQIDPLLQLNVIIGSPMRSIERWHFRCPSRSLCFAFQRRIPKSGAFRH